MYLPFLGGVKYERRSRPLPTLLWVPIAFILADCLFRLTFYTVELVRYAVLPFPDVYAKYGIDIKPGDFLAKYYYVRLAGLMAQSVAKSAVAIALLYYSVPMQVYAQCTNRLYQRSKSPFAREYWQSAQFTLRMTLMWWAVDLPFDCVNYGPLYVLQAIFELGHKAMFALVEVLFWIAMWHLLRRSGLQRWYAFVSLLYFALDIGLSVLYYEIDAKHVAKPFPIQLCGPKLVELLDRYGFPAQDLRLADSFLPGAYTLRVFPGIQTIVVQSGLLSMFSGAPEVALAVIGHELGHFVYWHTTKRLFVSLAWYVLVQLPLLYAFLNSRRWRHFEAEGADAVEAKEEPPIVLRLYLFEQLFSPIERASIGIVRKFMQHQAEYQADDFSIQHGIGRPLIKYFASIANAYQKLDMQLPAHPHLIYDHMMNSHPSLANRMQHIARLTAEEAAAT